MARFVSPVPQFFTDTAALLSGGKLYFYEAGTSTPKPTYSDSALTTPNANPIVLNARGESATKIYAEDEELYKIVLKDASDVTIWTRDDVAFALDSDDDFSQSTVTPTGATTGQTLANYLADTVMTVKAFRAKGDGTTDDSAAFIAAQAWATARGGGRILVPYTDEGYVIGDGATAGSCILPTDNTEWIGEGGVKLVNRGQTSAGSPRLFYILDASNVRISGFTIDGVDATVNGIVVDGTSDTIDLTDLHFVDHKDYCIGLGDFAPVDAFVTNLRIERFKYSGSVNSATEIMTFFSRAVNTDNTPPCRNLILRDIDIDCSGGSSTTSNHSANGIKVQNIDGVLIEGVRVRGGAAGAVTITNGARNVDIKGLHCSLAQQGLIIQSSSQIVATVTQNIRVDGYTYVNDGASPNDGGVAIRGRIPGLKLSNIDLIGADLNLLQTNQFVWEMTSETGRFSTTDTITGGTSGATGQVQGHNDEGHVMAVFYPYTSGTFQEGETVTQANTGYTGTISKIIDDDAAVGWQWENIRVKDAVIKVDTPTTARTSINQLQAKHITLEATTAGTATARMQLGESTTRALGNSVFDGITLINGAESSIVNRGNRNAFLNIVDRGGYDSTISTIVSDTGNNTEIIGVFMDGDAAGRRFPLRKTAGSGVVIQRIRGDLGDADGVEFTGISSSDLPQGDVLVTLQAPLDLSGSAVDVPLFVADEDYRILGAALVTVEATSADTGANIRLGRLDDTTAYKSFASPVSSSAGTVTSYINDADLTSRQLDKGKVLTCGTSGGKTGAGTVSWHVSLLRVMTD